ncbi:MAG: VWA domain-containing protein [Burkholderiaceae bacterium]
MSHLDARAPLAPGGRRWPSRSPWRAPDFPAGHVARSGMPGDGIDWLATLGAKGPQALQRSHLRWREWSQQPAPLHLIALDVSGSMQRGGRLAWAKGYAARLIEEAARQGEQVALLTFGGQGVQLLQAPGAARRSAVGRVRPLGGGGATPLVACLDEAQRLLLAHQRRQGQGERRLWLLTDGRSLERPEAPAAANHIVVVDFDDPLHPIGRSAAWARQWRAELRRPQRGPGHPTPWHPITSRAIHHDRTHHLHHLPPGGPPA